MNILASPAHTKAVITPPSSLPASWLLVGWITIFFVGTDLFVVSPFLPAIARDFNRQPADLTLMVSLFSISYAVFSPVRFIQIWSRASSRMVSRSMRLSSSICILSAMMGMPKPWHASWRNRLSAMRQAYNG
jgi:predicted MFS family arabinose efflux permease